MCILKWDEEREEQASHVYKLSLLNAIEASWRADYTNQEYSYYASSYSSWLNYGTSLVTNIVENLQVSSITFQNIIFANNYCRQFS